MIAGWWHRARLPLTWLLTAAAALAAFCVLRVWFPGSTPEDSICTLRRVFGLACPTCGMTRAFAELAKGHIAAASRLHPLAPPLAVEFAFAWVAWGIAIFRPAWALPRRMAIPAVALTFGALLALWIGRLASGGLPR